ncbi:MAG: type VI secretion system ImpA family N-terminal domain-containing protein [Holosporales bacterium]|jgi:type VI secretion system protein ImpA|nr:type VI secretion system ImpA family N-terminal domain-containing protein [Holosporales bacterium]
MNEALKYNDDNICEELDSVVYKILNASTADSPRRNLCYEPVYDKIKNARTEEDETLDMGIWQRELKKANWEEVCELCKSALVNETNDLQIAVWLCEAWCVRENWRGLQASFLFVKEFLQKCWDNCYPLVETDSLDTGIEHRGRILEWFVGKMEERITFFPLNQRSAVMPTPLDLATWLYAQNLDAVERRSGSTAASSNTEVVTLIKFRRVLKQTDPEYILGIRDVLSFVREQIREIEDFLAPRCNNQEPSFNHLKEMIGSLNGLCDFALSKNSDNNEAAPVQEFYDEGWIGESYDEVVAEEKGKEESVEERVQTEEKSAQNAEIASTKENHDTPTEESTTHPNAGESVTIQLANRTVSPSGRLEAYEALKAVSEYLLEIEAHSPVPYIVRLVSGWHGKSLPDIIEDVTKGETQGSRILKMLAELAKNG